MGQTERWKMRSDKWAAPLCVVAAASVFVASLCALVFGGRTSGSERLTGNLQTQPVSVVTVSQDTSTARR
jgi:hypothetical protein